MNSDNTTMKHLVQKHPELPPAHEDQAGLWVSMIDAAHFLNVSLSFVIKEMNAGRLRHRKVDTHRRIEYDDLVAYRGGMQHTQDDALQALADEA